MKKNIIIALASAALLLLASCQKVIVTVEKGNGYLSFSEFALGLDETVDTKASTYSPAKGNYVIIIRDADDYDVMEKTYAEVIANDSKISLPAGEYTLIARSTADDIPYAAFEEPVYGATQKFSIRAGEVTDIKEVVCTLLQCKVTVAYSDDFLANVTGECKAKVSLTAGYPLEYKITQNASTGSYLYDKSAGYFAVNGNTLTVDFEGNYNYSYAKMSKSIGPVAAKQWRQIKFVPVVDEEGNATFDIIIQDLISDETLNSVINKPVDGEAVQGEDPSAPKGNGDIALEIDHEGGCDVEITDLNNIQIVPVATRDMQIRFKAIVPNGVKKFNVAITSDSNAFLTAVDAAEARNLNLISPLEANAIIFEVVPFPHGEDLLGLTEIDFNLDAAQDAITLYPGHHTFTMSIVDNKGCRNDIPVTMVVE